MDRAKANKWNEIKRINNMEKIDRDEWRRKIKLNLRHRNM